jgi:hypothetical protein
MLQVDEGEATRCVAAGFSHPRNRFMPQVMYPKLVFSDEASGIANKVPRFPQLVNADGEYQFAISWELLQQYHQVATQRQLARTSVFCLWQKSCLLIEVNVLPRERT